MKRLGDIVGNQNLIRLLDRSGLPQSALFWGPEGIGKKTIAWSLAARRCCRADGADLCGECPPCLKAQSRNHPDIVIVDAQWVETFVTARNKRFNPQVIPIEVVRELIREAQYHPYEADSRVFVIDEAEKLNEAAANSLLKTLEEPPPSTHIVLVTAYPEELLPTVRSRCQSFQFQGLSRNEVTAALETYGFAGEAQLLAALAQGSLGHALNLDLEAIRGPRSDLLDLLEAWLERPGFATVYQHTESSFRAAIRKRDEVRHLLSLLRLICQDLYFISVGTSQRIVNQDLTDRLTQLAQRYSMKDLPRLLEAIDKADRDVARYVSPMICFETLWLEVEDARNRHSSV